MNAIVHRVQAAFPKLDLRTMHVAGLRNASDKGSRGREDEMTEEDWRAFGDWFHAECGKELVFSSGFGPVRIARAQRCSPVTGPRSSARV